MLSRTRDAQPATRSPPRVLCVLACVLLFAPGFTPLHRVAKEWAIAGNKQITKEIVLFLLGKVEREMGIEPTTFSLGS